MNVKLMTLVLASMVSSVVLAGGAKNIRVPVEGSFFAQSSVPHKARLHDNGLLSLLERLRMIEKAQESIEVEYFIYDRDPSGRLFTQALIDAAQRGVKVRVLLDTFLIKDEINPMVAYLLRTKGVEVKYYNPSSILRLIKFQYRNHRKTLIVDGNEGMTGGRNIADEYFDLKHDFNFIDKDIQVEGPIVATMEASFNAFWDYKLSKTPLKPKKPYNGAEPNSVLDEATYLTLEDWHVSVKSYDRLVSRKLKSFAESYKTYSKQEKEALHFVTKTAQDAQLRKQIEDFELEVEGGAGPEGVCTKISFVSDVPGWGRKSWSKEKNTRDYVGYLMSNVEKSLMIDSPYFIPDKYTEPVLEKLVENKKEVSVFTNSLYSTDAIYVNAVFNTIVRKWIKRGLFPHIFTGSVIPNYALMGEGPKKARWGTHSKVFVFDRKNIFVGSYNFDPRSNRHSTEMGIYCESEELALSILSHLEDKRVKSHFLDSIEVLNQVKFENIEGNKRMLYYVLKPLSLLLRNLI